MNITINDQALRQAADEGMDSFVQAVTDAISQAAGGELNAEALTKLNPDQITLWGYTIMRDEVMNGGFVQLIYNGWGPFFFDNPFAKAMRLWGLHDLSKLIYKAKRYYDKRKDDLTRERSDEDFMALFELNPEFDELDDEFVENEEEWTATIAAYLDDHLSNFVTTD